MECDFENSGLRNGDDKKRCEERDIKEETASNLHKRVYIDVDNFLVKSETMSETCQEHDGDDLYVNASDFNVSGHIFDDSEQNTIGECTIDSTSQSVDRDDDNNMQSMGSKLRGVYTCNVCLLTCTRKKDIYHHEKYCQGKAVRASDKRDRYRGKNFTEADKEELLNIILLYDIVNSKQTDTYVNDRKAKAWMEIRDKFNAVSQSGPRTIPQLRGLYDNLKQKARKEKLEEKSGSNKSGEPENRTFSTREKLNSTLRSHCEPSENSLDTSNQYYRDIVNKEIGDVSLKNQPIQASTVIIVEKPSTLKKTTENANLTRNISNILSENIEKHKRSVCDYITEEDDDVVVDTDVDFQKLKRSCLEREHNLKMIILQEEKRNMCKRSELLDLQIEQEKIKLKLLQVEQERVKLEVLRKEMKN